METLIDKNISKEWEYGSYTLLATDERINNLKFRYNEKIFSNRRNASPNKLG